jgi:hypothetical protein
MTAEQTSTGHLRSSRGSTDRLLRCGLSTQKEDTHMSSLWSDQELDRMVIEERREVLKDEIERILRDSPKPLTTTEIHARIDIVAVTDKAMKRLVKRGIFSSYKNDSGEECYKPLEKAR